MIVTAWNKGNHSKTGSGYGLRIKISDRNMLFKKNWKFVKIILGKAKNHVEININPSFWNKCSELRHKEIGSWFIKLGCSKWPKGKPPKFSMKQIKQKRFIVQPLHRY